MTTFRDIFKSSFLEKVTEFSFSDVVIAMLISFALGLFIFMFTKRLLPGLCIPHPLVCLLWA